MSKTNDKKTGAPRSLDSLVRCLIADMAVALSDFEENAYDGDPLRRSDDHLCMRACLLIDRANEIVEATTR